MTNSNANSEQYKMKLDGVSASQYEMLGKPYGLNTELEMKVSRVKARKWKTCLSIMFF